MLICNQNVNCQLVAKLALSQRIVSSLRAVELEQREVGLVCLFRGLALLLVQLSGKR